MNTRRNFIKKLTTLGLLSSMPTLLFPKKDFILSQQKNSEEKIWAVLLHLSHNMWDKRDTELDLSESLWNDSLVRMVGAGANMVVIDLGDAVKYETHPEIAIINAWSKERLRDELKKIRKMGLEPIPKMNFSACHDLWLGPYSRMLSTKEYYTVCSDLIGEVMELFDTPRFFHLGMDEENVANQKKSDIMIVRQRDLWWGDLYFLFGEVVKRGSRPWVWSDYARAEPEYFGRMMPKSVIQSNWYNGANFDPKTNKEVNGYLNLEALGYDQIPGGSNFYTGMEKNIMNNVKFCTQNVSDNRLMGFIQSPWHKTTEEFREPILKSIEQLGDAKSWFGKNRKEPGN